MTHKILVVEDEQPIREMIGFALEQAGFDVTEAENSMVAVNAMANDRPDLLLLDWMLPGSSGIELARRFRREEWTKDIPIIMLTARGEEEEKIRGLEAGVDDYITKPFSPRELIARIRTVLRRTAPGKSGEQIEVDGLTLDTEGHRVLSNGNPIEMGPTEFRLLSFFMTHPERVYSRGQLLDRVWGSNVYVEERTVDVHIRRLRKALENNGHDRFIQTVRGAGYRFSNRV
jgi:two-component system phosphate regulon response regulator PhoB